MAATEDAADKSLESAESTGNTPVSEQGIGVDELPTRKERPELDNEPPHQSETKPAPEIRFTAFRFPLI